MDSQATSPANKPPTNHSTTKGWFLALLSLFLVGAGGTVFYRAELLNQHVTASLAGFTNETEWNKRQISDLQNELNVLRQRLQQQDEALRQQAQILQEWRGLSQVGPSSRGRDHSAILDARYFVRQANDQLLLGKDLAQAFLLLSRAQAELNRVADPQAAALKRAVAADLATLKSVPAVDITKIYQSLTSLRQQLKQLPLLLVPAQNTEVAPAAESNASSTVWKRGLDRFWRALRQMVIVYHLPSAETPPFITPDRRPYIYENLQAALGEAGWAVLHRNTEVYQSSLAQAAAWVRHYFSLNAPLTQTVLAQLQALQAVSVEPAKEVVLLSPKAFEDYLKAEPGAASSKVSG